MDSLPTELFLFNEYVSSRCNKLPLTFQSPPETPSFTVHFANAGKEDVDAAVQYARQAFKGPWKKTFTAHQRRYVLCKFAELLEENLDEIVEISRLSLGDAFAALTATEVRSAAEIWKYYGRCGERKSGDSLSTDDGLLKVTWSEPLGVTAGIISWNGPLVALASKAAPALVSGNTFILKPSEKSPFTVLALGHLIKEAGFPPGTFQILTGDANTGALLAAHSKVNVVSFTGSAATGKNVRRLATKSKRVSLDLGGKTPLIVFQDADISNAVQWAVSTLVAKPGQVCYSAARIYVQETVHDAFVEAYTKASEENISSQRRSSRSSSEHGSVAQHRRVISINFEEDNVGDIHPSFSEVEELEDDIAQVSPTIFTTDRSDADLYRYETLGPVAVISSFGSESEAVFRVNNSSYGLVAGVFTQDVDKALRVSAALESDIIGVNCASKTFTVTPGSPFRQVGAEASSSLGEQALDTYTQPRTAFVSMNM